MKKMNRFSLDTDKKVTKAAADADCAIVILGGEALVVAIERADADGCVGFYRPIHIGEYIHNYAEGYSYWIEDGELRCMWGHPEGLGLTMGELFDGSHTPMWCGDGLTEFLGLD